MGYAQAYGKLRSDTWDVMNDVEAGDPDPYPLIPAFPYAGNAAPDPIWGPRYTYASGGQWLRRAYCAVRLELGERVNAIVGFNHTRFHREGMDTWGGSYDRSQSKLSPCGGLGWMSRNMYSPMQVIRTFTSRRTRPTSTITTSLGRRVAR